jgi:hypothetical protein
MVCSLCQGRGRFIVGSMGIRVWVEYDVIGIYLMDLGIILDCI